MRVLLLGAAMGGINTLTYSLGDVYNVTTLGRVALVFVATAISMMAAVALDPSRQTSRLARQMMAAASVVMFLLTTLGLADGLFGREKLASKDAISTPISLDGPFGTINGEGKGKIVLVVKNK